MSFNKKLFYDAVRKIVFGGRLSQAQLDGTQSIIDSALRNNVTDPHHVAHILAHVRRETGGYMLPVKETVYPSSKDKNPSDATVIKRLDTAFAKGQLGKVKTPYWRDGGFGRGQIQLTHLTAGGNYDKFGKILKLPLRENPSLALDLKISSDIAVIGMRDGVFRTKKLSDFNFPKDLDNPQATNPRRIVNGNDGTDKEVAKDHRAFYTALVDAGWKSAQKTEPTPSIDKKLITQVQDLLWDKGYPEVGESDGLLGKRTRNAILAFQADNHLPLTGVITDALIAQLVRADKRDMGSREKATAHDLKAEPAVKDGSIIKKVGVGILTTSGLGGLLDGTGTLTQLADGAGQLRSLIETVAPILPWLLVGAAGVAVYYFGRRVINGQVAAYREGRAL